MTEPKISIVIPSLNQGKFIGQTIQSLLDQGHPHLEILVMDGASTDNTLDILKSFSGQITWFSEKDQGQSHAINKGLRLSTGDICGFINSDDVLLPGALHSIMTAFKSEDTLWVTGDYQVIDASGAKMHSLVVSYKRFLRHFSSLPMLMLANYIVQPSTFWRRELMEKIGYLDEKLHFTMDYDYWLRAFKVSKPAIIPSCLSAFRIHETSKGSSRYVQQFNEEVQVLSNYTTNKIVLSLHKFHNRLIVAVYRHLK